MHINPQKQFVPAYIQYTVLRHIFPRNKTQQRCYRKTTMKVKSSLNRCKKKKGNINKINISFCRNVEMGHGLKQNGEKSHELYMRSQARPVRSAVMCKLHIHIRRVVADVKGMSHPPFCGVLNLGTRTLTQKEPFVMLNYRLQKNN